MIMRAFTLYSLGVSLEDTPPGFGVTVNYEVIEGMIERLVEQNLPADLVSELQELADRNNCDFKDWSELRFVQFVKRREVR